MTQKLILFFWMGLVSYVAAANSKILDYQEFKTITVADSIPKFDRLLLEKIKAYSLMYDDYKTKSDGKKKDELWDQIQKSRPEELAQIHQILADHYLLVGKFPVLPVLSKEVLADKSPFVPEDATLPASNLSLLPSGRGWVFTSTSNPSLRDTCRTYLFSSDTTRIALATPTRLTVRRVSDGFLVGKPLPVTNVVYGFSTAHDLYVISQQKPSELLRINAEGKEASPIALPDSLAQLGYRIDQILPDSGLVVARRVQKGQTVISVFNFVQKKVALTTSFGHPVSASRLEQTTAGNWLLAAYQADKQGYTLRLSQSGQFSNLPTKLVREYKISADTLKTLVALQANDSLVTVSLKAPAQKTGIADHARYFDVKDNTVVYWKQSNASDPDKWALYRHKLGENPNKDKTGFYYDTNLRRDVPRITLRKDEVYFEDRSNNTANVVRLSRLK